MNARIISETLEMTSPTNLKNARQWYAEVRRFCVTIADKYSLPYWKVAGVVSALSPRNRFDRNLVDAENVIKLGNAATVATFGNNKRKALAIIAASDINQVYAMFEGRKTLSFFDNIVNPRSQRVTVDVWIIKAFKIEGSLTDKKYREAEEAIQDYAAKINVKPCELQAMLWVAVRGKAY
jgi:hypothetical protein